MEAPAGQPSAQDSSVNVVRENGHTTSTITFKESGFQETSRSGVSADQRSKSRSLSHKKNQTGGNEQPGVTPPPPVLATSNLQKSSVSSSKGLPAPKKSTNEASKPAQPAASSRIVSDGPGASSEMPLRKPSASGGAGSTKPTKHKRQPSAGLNGHQTSPSSTMKASRLQTARDKKREPSKETKPAGKARESTNPRKSQGGAAAGGQKGEATKPAGPGVAAKLSADEKALLEKLRKENEEIMAKMKALKEKTQQNKSALTQQKNKKADAEKEEKRKQDSKKQEVQKLADKIKHHQTDHEKALRDMLMIEKQAKKIKEAQEFARSLSEIRKQRDEARKQNEELNRERAKSIKQLHLNVCSKVDTFRKKKIEATKQAKSEMIEEVEKHKAVSLLEKEANRQSVLQRQLERQEKASQRLAEILKEKQKRRVELDAIDEEREHNNQNLDKQLEELRDEEKQCLNILDESIALHEESRKELHSLVKNEAYLQRQHEIKRKDGSGRETSPQSHQKQSSGAERSSSARKVPRGA